MDIYRDSIVMIDLGNNQGSVQSGIRPAVVIQNNIGNEYSTTTIVVPITGSTKRDLPIHHELYKKDYGCLKCDSTILAEQILTVSKSQISEVIGYLRSEDSIKLNEILFVSISLNNRVS